jgi:ribosomal protein S18 acetylase RimI-like enzyme
VSRETAWPGGLVAAIEEANVNAFPSAMAHFDGRWMLRLSPGNPARRVNSLNIYDASDDADAGDRLAAAQALFASHGVPFHLRRTPLTPAAVLDICDRRGWPQAGRSDVWARRIADAPACGVAAADAAGATIQTTDLASWLTAFAETGGTRPETVTPVALEQLGSALSRVASPCVCLVARDEAGRASGVAVAIADRGLLGIYDVAVAPGARRRGLGARLVEACLAAGRAAGADTAWLQVTAENGPARALYAGLGFSHVYDYAYRHPPAGDAKPVRSPEVA